MSSKQYHLDRERQCRDMADRAGPENVKMAHSALADLHHKLADEADENQQDSSERKADALN